MLPSTIIQPMHNIGIVDALECSSAASDSVHNHSLSLLSLPVAGAAAHAGSASRSIGHGSVRASSIGMIRTLLQSDATTATLQDPSAEGDTAPVSPTSAEISSASAEDIRELY